MRRLCSASCNKRMRVGVGYDAHALGDGRKLILGGVEIPHTKGLVGHSDADVLTHAVCDAILGAAGRGDIGQHFPDTDVRFSGISSLKLLTQVMQIVGDWTLVNVDAVVVAQAPKLAPYMRAMCENLARAMGTTPDRVHVKATTTERMGFEGRQEGISAQAVCLLEKRNHEQKA